MKKLPLLLLLSPVLLQAQPTLKLKFKQIQPIATQTILGRDSSGTGNISALSPAQIRSMLNVADGATNVTDNSQIANGEGYINASQVPSEITDGADDYGKTVISYSGWNTQGGFSSGIVIVTTGIAIQADAHTIIVNPSGNITIEMPAASSYPGRELEFSCYGSTTGYVIDLVESYNDLAGNTTSTYTVAATPAKIPQFFRLKSDGSAWYLISNSN